MASDVEFDLDALPDPGDRFEKIEIIHDGFDGVVWKAKDDERDGGFVAIKVFRNPSDAEREFRILTLCQTNPVFPILLGAFCNRTNEDQYEVWIAMEYLVGSLSELAKALIAKEKRMREEHIAFVLREVMQGLIDLHSKGITYRDLRASNVMVDSAGDIKLVDFSSCKILDHPEEKINDALGSPHWTAPEVFQCLPDLLGPVCNDVNRDRRGSNVSFVRGSYDVRADVWSLGILAIELGDGDPPLFDVHPSRAMYQVVRNPPPGLQRESDWSEEFVDFIAECLTCNPEYRPVAEELKEHPFIASVPEKDFHLRSEMKLLSQENRLDENTTDSNLQMKICPDGRLRAKVDDEGHEIFPDDLARMPELSVGNILDMLEKRFARRMPNAFAGDILLAINGLHGFDYSGKYDPERYMFRAMSDNEPHVMAVADKAWQEMLHHKLPQLVVLSGVSGSGKTGHFNALTHHLCRLGHGNRLLVSKLQQLNCIVNALICAPTKTNPYGSTRAIHLQELTFSKSGKATGANNWIYGLDVNHLIPERFKKGDGTFLIFYYFYNGLSQMGSLEKYKLDPDISYKILAPYSNLADPGEHAAFFGIIQSALKVLDLSDHETENIYRCLAAVINLAQVVVESDGNGGAVVRNMEFLYRAAGLLGVDQERLACSVTHELDHAGVPKRRMRYEVARQHVHSLITCLYHRLVDWVVHVLNTSFSLSRKVFGDDYSIGLLDHYGYEDFHGENGLPQLFVNTTNDFMQYYYNQQIFVKELGELDTEEIQVPGSLIYKNIRPVVDFVLHASEGLFKSVDMCSAVGDGEELLDIISKSSKTCAEGLISVQKAKSTFQLLHAHKPITYYDIARFGVDNAAHLFEQVAVVMAASNSKLIRALFGAKIRLTGGLVVDGTGNFLETPAQTPSGFPAPMLAVEGETLPPMSKHMPTRSKKGFSQTKTQLTRATMCRAALMSLMNKMVVCSPLFVRCIKSSDQPAEFQQEAEPKLNLDVVARQLKHLGVMETIKLRQVGYSSRIPFSEFLRRYKFLVFDFEETVEENEENCKLLFLRLKIEDGWALGKTEVCVRYYVEEYLARLYEKEVRKIIKIQAMVRRYLARMKEKNKIENRKKQRRQRTKHHKFGDGITEEEAAVRLQKAFRGFKVRKELPSRKVVDNKTVVTSPGGMKIDLMHYWRKWRSRTVFQQLQRYRAQNMEQLIYFSQQVHLYAQEVNGSLRRWNDMIASDKIEPKTYLKPTDVLRSVSPRPLCKLPLRLADMMYIETSHLRDPFGSRGLRTPTSPMRSPSPAFPEVDDDDWDAPLRKTMRAPPYEIPTLKTISHHEEWRDVMLMRSAIHSHQSSPVPNGSPHRQLLSPADSGASRRNSGSVYSTHVARTLSKHPSGATRSPTSPSSSRHSPAVSPTFSHSSHKGPSPSFGVPTAPTPPPSFLIKKFDQQQQPANRWQPKQPSSQRPNSLGIGNKQGGQPWLPMSAAVAVPGPECLNDMRNRLRKTACGQAIHSGSDLSSGSPNYSGYTTEKITPKSPKGFSVAANSKFGVIKRPKSPEDEADAPAHDFKSMLRKTNYRPPAMDEENAPRNPRDLLWEELQSKLDPNEPTDINDAASSIGRTPPYTGTSTPTNFNYNNDQEENDFSLTIDASSSGKSSPARSCVSTAAFVVKKAMFLADHFGPGGSSRRDSETLAQHMKNLTTTNVQPSANNRKHSGEGREVLVESSSEEGSQTLSLGQSNPRTPTPTLVYQPSSVDEGDEDGHISARLVFDDDEEITF